MGLDDQLLELGARKENDPLSMSNSENPNAQITQMLFDGTNFVAWNRQLRRALGAKMKLGFLDGTVKRPEDDSKDLPRWVRCDEMVGCWILNSMTPDLSNSFILMNTARELWTEIMDRYSQSNAPILFQLKQELLRIVQGDLSVTSYYAKLKKCWDELQLMNAIPSCCCGNLAKCTCKVMARIQELEDQDRLLHFLVNLNADYDVTKSQILAMDPVPTLNRAYRLVLQVERQKQLSIKVPESSAFMISQKGPQEGQFGPKKEGRKSPNGEKKHCTVCNMDGHTSDGCFEVLGYPDWYKGKKNKRGSKTASNVTQERSIADTPLGGEDAGSGSKLQALDPNFVQALYQEIMKMHKGKSSLASSSSVNFAGPFE